MCKRQYSSKTLKQQRAKLISAKDPRPKKIKKLKISTEENTYKIIN